MNYTQRIYELISNDLYHGEYDLKNDNALTEIPTDELAIGSTAFSPSGKLFYYNGTEWVEV